QPGEQGALRDAGGAVRRTHGRERRDRQHERGGRGDDRRDGNPIGGDHPRSAFNAGPSACFACNTGSKRSPCFATRSSATAIVKSRGRTSSVSSDHRSGVDTGAPGFGRAEYTDAIVLPCPFCRWSTSTPARFFFSHSVVTS